MAPNINDVSDPKVLAGLADSRWNAAYIIDTKDQRGRWFSTWRMKQDNLDRVLDDDFSAITPSTRRPEAAKENVKLRVQNLIRGSLYDISRLVAETQGSIKMTPIGAGEDAAQLARLYTAIAQGYHVFNRGERLSQTYAGDLWGHSFAAQLHYVVEGDDYPHHLRLDPHGCLPNIVEDRLIDLIFTRTMPAEQANGRWPDLNILNYAARDTQVKIIEYFDSDQSVTTLEIPQKRGGRAGAVVQVTKNNGILPVSWAKFYTGDGRFDCPVLDGASMNDLMDQVTSLIVDNLEQAAYAPIFENNVINPGDFGPFTIHHGDGTANSQMTRIMPAPIPNGLFAAQQQWEAQARGSVMLPQQREGEIPGSQYSGSAIGMSTGSQTSLVRSIQREMGYMRERGIEIDFALDKMYLDSKKPLLAPAGDVTDYTPTRDIPKRYYCEVTANPAIGMDPQNAVVTAMQLAGNMLASKETARGWIPNLGDTGEEESKILREQSINLLFQGIMADPDPMSKYLFYQAVDEGSAPGVAIKAVIDYKQQLQAQQQAAAQAQAQPQGQGLPAPLSPEQVATQNLSLQKGGVPGTAEGQAGPAAPGAQGVPNLPPLAAVLGGGLPGPAPQPIQQPFTSNLVR